MSSTRFIVTVAISSFFAYMIISFKVGGPVSPDPQALFKSLLQGIGVGLFAFYIAIWVRTRRCDVLRKERRENGDDETLVAETPPADAESPEPDPDDPARRNGEPSARDESLDDEVSP